MADSPTNGTELIAPCGMNCSVCSRYLARRHDVRNKGVKMAYCAGCRPRDRQCTSLKKRCDLLSEHRIQFCYECSAFPCANLERIDARYQKRYRTSFMENLLFIKRHSLADFIKRENAKWRCRRCGEVVCCHNGLCFSCDVDRLRTKKQLYEWEHEQRG
jgi:Protein of unknown function (DUF3795)